MQRLSFLTAFCVCYLQQECFNPHETLRVGEWLYFGGKNTTVFCPGSPVYCVTPVHRLFVGCLTSQQHASVPLGWICSDNGTCCHTEIEVADQTFYLTQSQYADTRPTSPNSDPIAPGRIATGAPILKSLV